jgi:hypothetical protein
MTNCSELTLFSTFIIPSSVYHYIRLLLVTDTLFFGLNVEVTLSFLRYYEYVTRVLLRAIFDLVFRVMCYLVVCVL